jgi:hypothetical protein
MADFPIWMKIIVWGTIGLTVVYAAWGIFQSLTRA